MRITHVIRGDDHLANTPKHVALFRALGRAGPRVRAPRHDPRHRQEEALEAPRRRGRRGVAGRGILPEALFNFLALLGWSPGGDREILSREEMEREFSLDRSARLPSVFDPEKLLWMNAQYMARMPAEELLARAAVHAPAGVPDEGDGAEGDRAAPHARPHDDRDGPRPLACTRTIPPSYDADGMKKQVKPETPALLEKLVARYEALEDWTAESLEAALRGVAEEAGVSAGKLIHPTRLALTGIDRRRAPASTSSRCSAKRRSCGGCEVPRAIRAARSDERRPVAEPASRSDADRGVSS